MSEILFVTRSLILSKFWYDIRNPYKYRFSEKTFRPKIETILGIVRIRTRIEYFNCTKYIRVVKSIL